jgi:RNA polymerase sigma factor (sigma-70 family)
VLPASHVCSSWTSDRAILGIFEAQSSLADFGPLWYQECLPEWNTIWANCAKRFRLWRTPPRWSRADWWEETRAQAVASAIHAVRDFNPTRGVPLSAFVRSRVLAGVLTRYRQEWAFGSRNSPWEMLGDEESRIQTGQLGIADDPALHWILAGLARRDLHLIKRLYWDGWTERELAYELGVSQPEVSRRKHAILRALRRRAKFRLQRDDVE